MSRKDPKSDDAPIVKPTNGKVVLHCKGTRNGASIAWSLDATGGPPSGKIAKIEVPHDSGKCETTIHLTVTGGGGDVSFNKDDPIWVAQGSCPPPKGINTDQIVDVDPANKKLVFTNLNCGGPKVLVYQLNFMGAQPLDPEIKNGGGTNFM